MFNYLNLRTIIIILVSIIGCNGGYETPEVRTPEMESQAKNSVIEYLAKESLKPDGLVVFKSSVQPEPGFSYLYTGSGRCIEIIVLCYGQNCNPVRAYPYDRHGEKCPL